MTATQRIFPTLSTLMTGAHFGLFYAWVCTTMWGLDATDPRVAIEAMQAMNASVRNATFFPVFFVTPLLLLMTSALVFRPAGHRAGALFGVAGLLLLLGSVFLTMTVNVPMNEALAKIAVPQEIEAARIIWQAYSPDWQFWNLMRTLAAGSAALIALFALQSLPQR